MESPRRTHASRTPHEAPEPELLKNSLTARYVTLFGGEAISKLCALAAFAYLARTLSPPEFGRIELSLSVTVLFVLGTGSGLGSYGARVIAATPDRAPTLVARVILIRSIFALIAFACIAGLSARYGMPGLGLLAIYGLSVLGVPFSFHWVMQGLSRMRWVAVATALRSIVFVTVVFGLVRRGSDTRLVALAEVAGVCAFALLTTIALTRVLRIRPDWRGSIGGAWTLLQDAWPVGASELTWAVLWYSPGVILGALAKPEQVAWLAAPVRIVLALHTFVTLYFFNLLPNLSRALADGVDAWRDLARRSAGTSMWLACATALGFTLLAPWMVTTIYGPSFLPAALPLQIVIWLIPINWLNGHFRYSLIAAGAQRLEFASAVGAVVTTVTVAFLTVPGSLSIGAAIALLAGGTANLVFAAVALEHILGASDLIRAILPAAGTCAICLAVGLTVGALAGEIAGAAAGSIPYALTALSQDDELTRLRQVWLGR